MRIDLERDWKYFKKSWKIKDHRTRILYGLGGSLYLLLMLAVFWFGPGDKSMYWLASIAFPLMALLLPFATYVSIRSSWRGRLFTRRTVWGLHEVNAKLKELSRR